MADTVASSDGSCSGSGSGDAHSSAWRDLLPLLRGGRRAGEQVAAALVDICVEYRPLLPDIFHTLITSVLIADEWHARINAGKCICALTRANAAFLSEMLITSRSDGELLKLADLQVDRILQCQASTLLKHTSTSGNAGVHVDQTHTGDDGARDAGQAIYSKRWLRRQRQALRRRLGIEADTMDIRYAMEHGGTDELDMLVDDYDVDATASSSSSSSSFTVAPSNRSEEEKEGNGCNDIRLDGFDDLTDESWLARLVRWMIVGLLDPRWETRHGCSIGLSQLIIGLQHDGTCNEANAGDSSDRHASGLVGIADSCRGMPAFLLEDIMCSGICVLLLDEFMDFGNQDMVVAPVKEVAGQLIACASRYCTVKDDKDRVLALVFQMTSHDERHSWLVRFGGCIALKYLILAHIDSVFRTHVAVTCRAIIRGCEDEIDDMNCVSCHLVKALSIAVCSNSGGDGGGIRVSLPQVIGIVQTLARIGERVTAFSITTRHLCSALKSCLDMALKAEQSSLAGTDDEGETLITVATQVVRALTAVGLKISYLQLDARLECLQVLASTLDAISEAVADEFRARGDPHPVRTSQELCAACIHLLIACTTSIGLESVVSVGDLHLVDKVEQDAQRSNARYDRPVKGTADAKLQSPLEATTRMNTVSQVGSACRQLALTSMRAVEQFTGVRLGPEQALGMVLGYIVQWRMPVRPSTLTGITAIEATSKGAVGRGKRKGANNSGSAETKKRTKTSAIASASSDVSSESNGPDDDGPFQAATFASMEDIFGFCDSVLSKICKQSLQIKETSVANFNDGSIALDPEDSMAKGQWYTSMFSPAGLVDLGVYLTAMLGNQADPPISFINALARHSAVLLEAIESRNQALKQAAIERKQAQAAGAVPRFKFNIVRDTKGDNDISLSAKGPSVSSLALSSAAAATAPRTGASAASEAEKSREVSSVVDADVQAMHGLVVIACQVLASMRKPTLQMHDADHIDFMEVGAVDSDGNEGTGSTAVGRSHGDVVGIGSAFKRMLTILTTSSQRRKLASAAFVSTLAAYSRAFEAVLEDDIDSLLGTMLEHPDVPRYEQAGWGRSLANIATKQSPQAHLCCRLLQALR
jgi:hypothetical protein